MAQADDSDAPVGVGSGTSISEGDMSFGGTRSSCDGPSGRRVAGNVEWEFTDTSRNGQCRNLVAYFLRRNAFKNFMAVVIMANAAAIGFESSARIASWQQTLEALSILESCFLGVYVIELGLRFYSFGWRCIYDHWVKFDLVLVVAGITTTWVMPNDDEAAGLGLFVALRLLRLVRLARTLKIIANIRDLWLLLQGFVDCMGVVAYTIGLLLIVIYILACIALELITLSPSARGPNANPEFEELVYMHFQDMGMTMLTLVQFASFDSIADIYTPFILRDPMQPVLLIFFTMAFVVLGIILMNLITAIIVNSALDQAQKDKEVLRLHEQKQKKKWIRRLRKILRRLDTDDSGTISLDEIVKIEAADRAVLLGQMDFEPAELFAVLDVKGQGVIEIDSFCDGIWDVSHSQVPLEVKRTEQAVQDLRKQVAKLNKNVEELGVDVARALRSSPALACEQETTSIWRELAVQIQEGVAQRVCMEIERCRVGRAGPQSFGIPLEIPPNPDIATESARQELAKPFWANVLLLEMQELRRECIHSFARSAAAARSGLQQPATPSSSREIGAVGENACFGNWQCLSPEADNYPPISEGFGASVAAEKSAAASIGVLPGGQVSAKSVGLALPPRKGASDRTQM